MYQRFKKKICVRYFTEMISSSFCNVSENKTRHNVSDILPCLLRDPSIINQLIRADTMCYQLNDLIRGAFGIGKVI